MVRPMAGEVIAVRCAVVIRGGRNPFVVEATSKRADAAGVEAPMPTCPPL